MTIVLAVFGAIKQKETTYKAFNDGISRQHQHCFPGQISSFIIYSMQILHQVHTELGGTFKDIQYIK